MTEGLRFIDVQKDYGTHHVFKGLSIDFARGTKVMITGPSGVGKTTLLSLACGLEKPTRGSVEGIPESIGYVFQEPRLLPWATALENVLLPLQAVRKDTSIAIELLEALGIAAAANQYPHKLSGGMVQRVAIARAIAINPGLLLFDEPFQGLDESTRKTTEDIIQDRLKSSDTIVLWVTHYPDEVSHIADRHLEFTAEGQLEERLLTPDT